MLKVDLERLIATYVGAMSQVAHADSLGRSRDLSPVHQAIQMSIRAIFPGLAETPLFWHSRKKRYCVAHQNSETYYSSLNDARQEAARVIRELAQEPGLLDGPLGPK